MSEYSELLEFIQKSGAKITELEEKVAKLEKEKGILTTKVASLEGEVSLKKEQIKNMADVCNNWHSQYSDCHSDKIELERQVEVLMNAIAVLSPKLAEEVQADFDDGIFGELLSYTRSRYRGGCCY